jgi:hypothetical protein
MQLRRAEEACLKDTGSPLFDSAVLSVIQRNILVNQMKIVDLQKNIMQVNNLLFRFVLCLFVAIKSIFNLRFSELGRIL